MVVDDPITLFLKENEGIWLNRRGNGTEMDQSNLTEGTEEQDKTAQKERFKSSVWEDKSIVLPLCGLFWRTERKKVLCQMSKIWYISEQSKQNDKGLVGNES